MKRKSITAVLTWGLLVGAAAADTVTLPADRDNTLYQDATGGLSNGSGGYIFCGATATGPVRRCLVRFNVAGGVPTGATITSATLTLHISRTISAADTVALHRVLADWGEGASVALGEGGRGAPAEPGDATWRHRFYPSVFWATPGGDFAPTASATTLADQIGFVSWSGPGLVADVQAWLDDPSGNFGWLLKADETTLATARRYDSRENVEPTFRPALTVEYTLVTRTPGDLNCDGLVNNFDIDPFVLALSDPDQYALSFPNCDIMNADVNNDGAVNNFDIDPFVALISGG